MIANMLSQEETVGLIVWSAAEIAVTMICIGIPVCRPLYKRYLDKWTSRDASKYQEQIEGGGSHPLRTFGGSTLRPGQVDKDDDNFDDRDSITREERKLGIGGPFTKSYAVGGGRVCGDNQSDEEILVPNFRRSQQRAADLDAQHMGMGIRVTDEYKVTSS